MIKIIGCNRFRTKRRVFSNSPTVSRLKARWSCLHTLDSESLPLQLNKLCSWHIGLESNPKKIVHKFLGWWVSKEHVTRVMSCCHPILHFVGSYLHLFRQEVTPMQLRCLIPQNCGQMCRHKAWFRLEPVMENDVRNDGKINFGHPKSCPYTTCPQKRPWDYNVSISDYADVWNLQQFFKSAAGELGGKSLRQI